MTNAGSEFQTGGTAHRKERFAKSMRANGWMSRGVPVERFEECNNICLKLSVREVLFPTCARILRKYTECDRLLKYIHNVHV